MKNNHESNNGNNNNIKIQKNFSFDQPVSALIPHYLENGDGTNGTLIILSDGEQIFEPKTFKTSLNRMMAAHGKTLSLTTEKSNNILGTQHVMPPIYTEYTRVFVPVRMREPEGKKDGAYGYFCINDVELLPGKKDYARVYFENSSLEMKSRQKLESASRYCYLGFRLLKHNYKKLQEIQQESEIPFL